MDYRRVVVLALFGIAAVLAWSCKRKYTCSAYQSVFFLDQSTANPDLQAFAFLRGEDSLPVDLDIKRKTKVLLIKPVRKKHKERSWDVIRMETVFPPKPEDDSATRALIDSLQKLEASWLDTSAKKKEIIKQDSVRKNFDEDIPEEYKKAYIDTVVDTRTEKEKRRDAKRAAKEAKRAQSGRKKEIRKTGKRADDGGTPVDEPIGQPVNDEPKPKKGAPPKKEEEPAEGF